MFKVAGVSLRDGQMKVRWASDMTRVKVLVKTGHTDINLVDLPEAMDKGQAVTFLKTTDLYSKPEYREAIDAADAKYNGVGAEPKEAKTVKDAKPTKAAKPASTVKAKGGKVGPSLDAIRARAATAAGDTSPATGEASKEVSVKEVA